jgi:hypothetical protein
VGGDLVVDGWSIRGGCPRDETLYVKKMDNRKIHRAVQPRPSISNVGDSPLPVRLDIIAAWVLTLAGRLQGSRRWLTFTRFEDTSSSSGVAGRVHEARFFCFD